MRTSGSKRKLQKSSKPSKAPRVKITNDDETSQLESVHSLLLAALKYWEVERDLIEERVAAVNR